MPNVRDADLPLVLSHLVISSLSAFSIVADAQPVAGPGAFADNSAARSFAHLPRALHLSQASCYQQVRTVFLQCFSLVYITVFVTSMMGLEPNHNCQRWLRVFCHHMRTFRGLQLIIQSWQ